MGNRIGNAGQAGRGLVIAASIALMTLVWFALDSRAPDVHAESLGLSGTKPVPEAEWFPNVKWLGVHHLDDFSEESGRRLREYQELETVRIILYEGETVPEGFFEALSGVPSLRRVRIDLNGQPLTAEFARRISRVRQLDSLELEFPFEHPGHLESGAVKHLARLRNLKSLLIWTVNLSPEESSELVGLEALEMLRVGLDAEYAESVAILSRLPRLRNALFVLREDAGEDEFDVPGDVDCGVTSLICEDRLGISLRRELPP